MSYHPAARPFPGGRGRGRGSAMGDDAVPLTPIGALAAQVNRFGATAPPAYRFASRTFSTSATTLEPDLAIVAVTIYQRRATDAFAQFHDAGSEAEIASANAAFANPVGFVSTHMAQVTQAIGNFADSLNLPSGMTEAVLSELTSGQAIGLAVGFGLLAWLFARSVP